MDKTKAVRASERVELVAIGKAASILGVTHNTLRNWEKRGLIRPYRVGPRLDRRFNVADLLEMRG